MPPTPPRLVSEKKRSPSAPRTPYRNAIFARCQILTFDPVFQVLLVAVLRIFASPSATPKCSSGTSTLGTAVATRSHDVEVRNSFPECNTPLISAYGALSSTPCW